MIYKTLGFLVIICSAVGAWQVLGSSSKEKEKWVQPDAWGKEVEVLKQLQESNLDSGFCKCNAEGNADDVSSNNKAALFVLKKFLRSLFNREKLQYDEQFSLYQRELLFTISQNQLEILQNVEDPRDLDTVLTEIVQNLRSQNDRSSNSTWLRIFALIWDILKDCVLLLRFSEVRFIGIVVSIILAGWFIHRKHNISIIVMIIGGFLVFGYFHTYLECNRELEMKQMIEVIEHNERITKPYEPRWYSPITNFFGSSGEEIIKQERREKVKRESKLNLSFCRPDHVLLMYANDIFLKQLEFLIEKCTLTVLKVKENLSFPYNYIAAIGLIVMIVFIIKLTFEHVISPRVWTGYFQRTNSNSNNNTYQALPHNEDRISGENLKILLNAIATPKKSNTNVPTISSVQEVIEALEFSQEHSDSANDSNTSNSSNNSSNSSHNLLNQNNSKKDLLKNTSSINAVELDTGTVIGDKDDADFILISQVKSKVLLQDVPNDND